MNKAARERPTSNVPHRTTCPPKPLAKDGSTCGSRGALLFRRRMGCHIALAGLLCMVPMVGAQQGQVGPSVAVKLGTDRELIYQYESFMLTVELLSTGVRLGQRIELDGLPESTTLLMGPLEELPIERSLEGRTIIEKRRYRARCRALVTGPLRVAPTVTAMQIVQQRMFIGRQWVEAPIALRVAPIEIPIAALPPPPQDRRFSSAVGRFSFTVDPQPLDVAVGDLIKLKIRIEGDGFLDTISSPATASDAGFKVYPPTLLEKKPDSITFEQVLIPLGTNVTTIPALTLTTFDARAGSYQTQTQGPYRVTFHARRSIDRSQQYRPTVQAGDPAQERGVAPVLALREPVGGNPDVVAAHRAAAQAYSTGYAAAALEAYAALPAQEGAWLAYNRGVIQLAAGAYGEAIAQLLRSLYVEPRNATTRDTLARACQVVGVAMPDWLDRGRARWRRSAVWEHAVVIAKPVEARLAPSTGARPLFAVQAGEVVLIREWSGAWLSVQRGTEMGWVPAQAVIRILPFSLGL